MNIFAVLSRVALLMAFTQGSVLAAESAKTEAANRKIMHEYASCVVKQKREQASDAIVSNSDNATIMRRYPELVSGACLGRIAGSVQMTFSGDLYRYALADALVNLDFSSQSQGTFTDRLPLAHLAPLDRVKLNDYLAKTKSKRKRDEAQQSFNKQYLVVWLSRYGECVVRNQPVKARQWLLTPPGGPEETSRINDLRLAFNECLGDGTMKFNRVTMRGTVAINYYRLAMATVQPAAGKTQ